MILQTTDRLVHVARILREEVEALRFKPPVAHVYNPLNYAWDAHEIYLRRFGHGVKNTLFIGMNPGPFGMMQTGVPFGEIAAVRDWMGIKTSISKPVGEHAKRPILGFDCPRSEVSGKRVWGLFAQRFGRPENFFAGHFVVNYCPLAFLQESGANFTPDKLPHAESKLLFDVCDEHLRETMTILQPKWVIGIGAFATSRVEAAAHHLPVKIGQILHPSPASPAANRDWAGKAAEQLEKLGVW